MVVKCEQVWREISNYLDDDVSPDLRAAIDQHVAGCKECAAVIEGTRNVVQLYGDERMLEVPLGFSHRLQRRLEDNMNTRRNFMGWLVAAAAAAVVVGSFEIVRSSSSQRVLRSEHAQAGSGVPPEMLVLVSADSKLFHVSGCPFIHDKEHVRTVVAREAEQEGYTPCTRCMKKYLGENRPDQPIAGVRGERS